MICAPAAQNIPPCTALNSSSSSSRSSLFVFIDFSPSDRGASFDHRRLVWGTDADQDGDYPARDLCEFIHGEFARWLAHLLSRCSVVAHALLQFKPARTIQSLVRLHWLNALAATVNRFTAAPQIRHFVMAITGRLQRR
jgi:hypothetical protein